MMLKCSKLIFLILLNLIYFDKSSYGFKDNDCINSSFYIKNINVDLTKDSINEARSEAETKAKSIGFKRLIKRLTIKNKDIKINNSEIADLVDYIKINSEANSDKRYIANFDFCFKRSSVIKFFQIKKIHYAETYREPIAVLPIFKGLRGFILWDENDKWYKRWKQELNHNDGLVKLELAKGNFYFNRNLNANLLSKSNKQLIKNLIKNEKTNALLIVLAEPVLKNDGKIYLLTYAKFYNSSGNLVNTIYRNLILLDKTTSLYDIEDNLINLEVRNIIHSIQDNWKKDNLINTQVYDEVDLIIPIDAEVSTYLDSKLLFNDKFINVRSTEGFFDNGLITIGDEILYYREKTPTTFNKITREQFGTSKKLTYDKDSKVKQKDIRIWSFVLNEISTLPFVTETKVLSLSKSTGRIIVKFMGDKKTFFQAANEKKIIFKDFKYGQYILVN